MTSSVRAIIGAEVLVIDKDERVGAGMQEVLSEVKINVTSVDDPNEAWAMFDRRFFSVVIIDLDTPTPNTGIETAGTVQVVSPLSSILMLTPRKNFESAVSAIRAGAIDVIHKAPDSVQYLKERVQAAAAASLSKRELSSILGEVSAAQETFLRLFMEAERRSLELQDQMAGRDERQTGGEVRILVVAADDKLAAAIREGSGAGFEVELALTGGEALDRSSSSRYQMAFVSDGLPDLPSSMVVRTIVGSQPECMVMTYRGPGQNGRVDLADTTRPIAIVPEFKDFKQLTDRLDELSEAFRAKERERRYTQAFREKHYDFVRKYVGLKERIDRVVPRR